MESFKHYFSVEIADSPEQISLGFRIRYRVYCEEFNFEPSERFPDGLEYDEYDAFSRHCLIRHRATGEIAGYVRLVPALSGRNAMPLPFERYCSTSLDHERLAQLNVQRNDMCEISRLAVDGMFRRRDDEFLSRFGEIGGSVFSNQERRTFSLIAVALFLSAVVMTENDQRESVFAMMEPFLPRMMNKVGINFQRVGKDMDFHGIRAAYYVDTQSVIASLLPEYNALYQWVKKSITV